jgi:small subunit ribosomal protein S3
MGQKVHPVGFRLGISHHHSATWFAPSATYAHYVREDIGLRQVFRENLPDAGIVDIHITREDARLSVKLFVTTPRAVAAVDLQSLVPVLTQRGLPSHMRVYFIEVRGAHAVMIADQIALQLEKRVPFRKALRQAIKQARKDKVKGLKVQIAGRLNGAEIARSEWAREGRVPLHTLRAHITYCARPAHTIYGVLGIKVWLYT